eukprot:3875303-Amphidinium_carterae.1
MTAPTRSISMCTAQPLVWMDEQLWCLISSLSWYAAARPLSAECDVVGRSDQEDPLDHQPSGEYLVNSHPLASQAQEC